MYLLHRQSPIFLIKTGEDSLKDIMNGTDRNLNILLNIYSVFTADPPRLVLIILEKRERFGSNKNLKNNRNQDV